MQTAAARMSLPCTTGYRPVPIADNEAGWREALAKLAAFVEAD
jgi:hypothetical protein